MNEVKLVGLSGADAEIKKTQSGFSILNLSLATSEKERDKDEWKSTWHRVVVLGKTAEKIAPQIKKGSKVFVSGKIQVNQWEKNGEKRTSVEVLAREIYVIERAAKTPYDDQHSQMGGNVFDSDIPF